MPPRRAEDFYLPLKIRRLSAGFEPANLGTKGQHATSRPPKLLRENNVEQSQRGVLTLLHYLLQVDRTMVLNTLWQEHMHSCQYINYES
jgi:hypothetical protein